MARTDEIVAAFLAAHGNRFLSDGTPVPRERLRRFFPTERAFDRGLALPDEWLDGAARIYAVDTARLGVPQTVKVGEHDVPTRMLHGFAGSCSLALAVSHGVRYDLYSVGTSYPPRSDLTVADVVAFVEGSLERAKLEEHVLWWNEHNLHWTSEPGWAAFVRAATARNEPRLVDDMGVVLSNVAFSGDLRRAWTSLTQAHRTPDFGPIFELRRVESRDDVRVYRDRKDARQRLAAAIDAVAAFSDRENLRWGDYFRGARLALDGAIDQWVARDFEGALDDEGLALLAGTWCADAFGGMGSWNDEAPTDQAEYARVSQALYEALRPAVEAAINVR